MRIRLEAASMDLFPPDGLEDAAIDRLISWAREQDRSNSRGIAVFDLDGYSAKPFNYFNYVHVPFFSNEHLDTLILLALFKSGEIGGKSMTRKLALAMNWSRVDLAKQLLEKGAYVRQ